MTLDYKDTQAFVGQDGKPKSPDITPANPYVISVTPTPELNQTVIGSKYGGGAFIKNDQITNGWGLTFDADGNIILNPQSFPDTGKTAVFGHEQQFNHYDPIFNSVTDLGLNATAVVLTTASKVLSSLASTGKPSQYLGGDLQFHELPQIVTYYWANTADAIGGLYKVMDTTTASAASNAYTVTGTGQEKQDWVSPIAGVGFTTIHAGTVVFHFHAAKTAGGAGDNAFVYFKLYSRTNPGGVETLVGTSGNSVNITAAVDTEYEVSFDLVNPVTVGATDRLVVKMFMTRTSGANPVITVYLGGNDDSHLHVPAVSPSGTGSNPLTGPGIGVDGSNNLFNMDGGRAATFGHEGFFNHQLLRYMNLPFFKSDTNEQDIALNNIGNLPFFDSTGTEKDVQIAAPISTTTTPDIIQTQVFTG